MHQHVRKLRIFPRFWIEYFNSIDIMNLLFREELRVTLNVFTVNELVSLSGCTDHDSLEDYVYQLNIKRGCKEGSK